MGDSVSQAIREQLVAAIGKRAAGFDGEARRVQEERIAALRAPPAGELGDAEASIEASNNRTQPVRGPLGELLDHIASDASSERAAYPELPALDVYRSLWSGIRSDSQLQQAVLRAPTDTGPLNSAALVSRSIALMRELSPEYLRQFLGYVDDLAWLAQMGGAAPEMATATSKKRVSRRSSG